MKILVFNPTTNRMETYYRSLSQNMPYANNLTVREFRGSSKSDVIWTDKRLMEAWNKLRKAYGKPINVGYAFKRIGEGGHSNQSQHYAGTAMDIGQKLSNAERDNLRELANKLGIFGYVEPKVLTPTWVHIDRRTGTSACSSGGYPLLKKGTRGVYVAVLQDALNTIGYDAGNIDGIFGNKTYNAVLKFQKNNDLVQDGIVGCETWKKLTSVAKGYGI